jgi:hypothetical protein
VSSIQIENSHYELNQSYYMQVQSPVSGSSVSVISKSSGALRYFYVGIGVLSLFYVALGFSYTYFIPMSQGKFSAPLLFHIHGMMYFAWILLIVSQPLLVRLKNIPLHRRIGIGGLILAAGMFIVGVAMAIVSGQRTVAAGSADQARAFLLIPITDMILFGTFVGMTIINLKNAEMHKRLILLATLSILPAAFGRIFGIHGINPATVQGFIIALLLEESTLLLGITYDMVTRKKVHPVYIWGGLAVVIIHVTRFPIGQTQWWKNIAERLIG